MKVSLIFAILGIITILIGCPEPELNPSDYNTFQDKISWAGGDYGSPTARTGAIPSSSTGPTARFGSLNKVGTVPNMVSTNSVGDATETYNVFAGDIIIISIIVDGTDAATKAFFQIEGATGYEEFTVGSALSINIRCGMPKNLGSGTVKFKISFQIAPGIYSNFVTIIINTVKQGNQAPTTITVPSAIDFDKLAVTGYYRSGLYTSMLLKKMSIDLTNGQDATLTSTNPSTFGYFAGSIAVDSGGNSYIGGYDNLSSDHQPWAAKFDRNLNKLIDATYTEPSDPFGYDEVRSIAIRSVTEIWVLGVNDVAGYGNVTLRKMNANLVPSFNQSYANSVGIDSLDPQKLLLSPNYIYVIGTATNNTIPRTWGYVAIYDFTGTFMVDATFAGGALDSNLMDADFDSMGNLYVGGYAQSAATQNDFWVAKINTTTLAKVNEATADFGSNQNDQLYGLDIHNDQIFTCGNYNNTGWWMVKWDLNLMNLNANTTVIFGNENAFDIKVDSQGAVNVVGDWEETNMNHGWRIMKYSNDLSSVIADATFPENGDIYDEARALDLFK